MFCDLGEECRRFRKQKKKGKKLDMAISVGRDERVSYDI